MGPEVKPGANSIDFIHFRPEGQSKQISNRKRCVFGIVLIISLVVAGLLLPVILLAQRNYKTWNSESMKRLQSSLLSQIHTLIQTANRSIYDPVVRKELRDIAVNDPSTCVTPKCLHTGISILEAMDFRVDPCENFYDFACGNFANSSFLRNANSASGDQFSRINERVNRITEAILQDPVEGKPISVFSQAQRFYSQCSDEETLDKAGLDSVWNFINEYGGWPLLGSEFPQTSGVDWTWTTIAGDLQRLGSPTIISLEVRQHPTKIEENMIHILPPKSFLSREYLLDKAKYPQIFEAYKTYVVEVASELLSNTRRNGIETPSKERILNDIEEFINFEIALAKLVTDTEEESASTKLGGRVRKGQYTLQKLQRESDLLTPKKPNHPNKVQWSTFISQVFNSSDNLENETLMVLDISYFRGLVPLLASTDSRVLKNYLMWRWVVTFTSGTTIKMRKINFKFHQTAYGLKEMPLRTMICAAVVRDLFSLAVGYNILRRMTEMSSKRDVEEMVHTIRVSMEEMLQKNHSSSLPLFSLAVGRKLNALQHCVGYPPTLYNVSAINDYYHTLSFEDKNEMYLRKYVRLKFWIHDKSLATLRDPYDKDCWAGMPWASLGEAYAYYDTVRNSINFPIGLIQPPFYRPTIPAAINYGGIGSIIGHEVSHSINVEGWSKAGLLPHFQEYWSCLGQHYSSYKVPSLGPDFKVNGYRTRSENLADHLGLAASFWAYKNLPEDIKNPKVTIMGLNMFSQDQLFFLSFSHMWCVSYSSEASLADELQSSSHTPGKFRVLGSLQNSEDFAKAFNCPVGCGMNPEKKCNTRITAFDKK